MMQDKGTKKRHVETVAVAPPWREASESFSAKVIMKTRPENVKEHPWEGLW